MPCPHLTSPRPHRSLPPPLPPTRPVSDELRDAFSAAGKDPSVSLVKITIDGGAESFVISAQQGAPDDMAGKVEAARELLDADRPCYVCIKTDTAGSWVLLYYVEDAHQVREKMLYSSSRHALRQGLNNPFSSEFFVAARDECTFAEFENSQRDVNAEEVMTLEETIKAEAIMESTRAISGMTRHALAMADVPINVDDGVPPLLEQFAAGGDVAVVLALNSDTEVLSGESISATSPEELHSALPLRDARYVVFRYRHTHDGAEQAPVCFVYYCSDEAAPRQKMFFSSAKSMVLKVLESHNITPDTRWEVSTPGELTTASANDELHPKEHVKETFAKPKRAGGGKRKMRSKFKFNA